MVKKFVEGMEDDSQAILEAKKLFQDPYIPAQLTIIKATFPLLVRTISSLQERLPLVKSVELVQKLQGTLTLEPFAGKLKAVLQKNPSYEKMEKIAKALQGSEEEILGQNPNVTTNMANAPIVTCDVERTFSVLKDINTPKRARLTEDHIKDVLMIQWNCSIV